MSRAIGLLLLLTGLGAAALAAEESATIEGANVLLHADRKAGLLVSRSCVRSDGTLLACGAAQATAKASMRGVSVADGVNPGAAVCRQLGGKVVLAIDAQRNETSFCRFGDLSVIACGSLRHYARKNDERRSSSTRIEQ